MRLDFLTPEAAVVGAAVLLPLLALAFAARRGGRARLALGLGSAGAGSVIAPAAAIALLGLLVAVGVSQPVLRSRDSVDVRADAAAFVVIDTSRSMLAAGGPSGETRLVRARRAALQIRRALGDVPVGLLSLSDRTLPHLFPSPDGEVFASTVARAIRGGHPEPKSGGDAATDLTALAAVPTENFFAPDRERRLVVVLTDGESAPIDESAIGSAYGGEPATALVLVQVGRPGERVFDDQGRPERGYVPVDRSDPTPGLIAALTGGQVFGEGETAEAAREAVRAVGASGPTEKVGRGEERHPLGVWALAAAAVPLAYLLRRRNADR